MNSTRASGTAISLALGSRRQPAPHTVSRQVQGYGRATEVRAPKYGSERTVYAAHCLIDMLAEHVAAHCPGEDPDRWLFGDGRPVPPGTVGSMWRRCDGMHLHHLRHYYASGLIAAGCDVVTVQRALGHRSASVTLNTYSHLWPSAEDKTRNAAAAMMAETLSGAGLYADRGPGVAL